MTKQPAVIRKIWLSPQDFMITKRLNTVIKMDMPKIHPEFGVKDPNDAKWGRPFYPFPKDATMTNSRFFFKTRLHPQGKGGPEATFCVRDACVASSYVPKVIIDCHRLPRIR